MNTKTSAIVLKTTKYNDNSVIVKLFTKTEGLKSYIASISKKGNRIAIFQGLNQIEIETSQHGNNKLARIKAADIETPYKSINSDWTKGAVIQFINELLYHCIREETANIDLYEFIKNHLLYYDEILERQANFHLYFVIKMTRYLGFFPEGSWKPGLQFHLSEGNYQLHTEPSKEVIDSKYAELLYMLSISNIGDLNTIKSTGQVRRELLKSVLLYYRIHLEGFGELKSIDVLETVFGE